MIIRPRILFTTLALLLTGSGLARAAVIDELLERIQQSEFVFGSGEGNAPFMPLAWVSTKSYGDSVLSLANGRIRYSELSVNQTLILPVWVGEKDMVLVGESFTWQQVRFKEPLVVRRNITSAMPLLAWLRQTGPKQQLGAFVAPQFVDGGSYAGYKLNDSSVYTGVFGAYWQSNRLAWAYGGVAIFEHESNVVLPYVGLLWYPRKELSVSLIAPWPSITYAPTKNFLVQFGLSPAGAALATTSNRQRLRVGYDSWNLQISLHRRITDRLWLSAGVGRSGLGSVTVTSGGDTVMQRHLQRGAVWSLQLSVRPPKKGGSVARPAAVSPP